MAVRNQINFMFDPRDGFTEWEEPEIGEKVKGVGYYLKPNGSAFSALYSAQSPMLYITDWGNVLVEVLDCSDILPRFARWCALDVADIWDAPEVVREYLKTGDESIREDALAAAESVRLPTGKEGSAKKSAVIAIKEADPLRAAITAANAATRRDIGFTLTPEAMDRELRQAEKLEEMIISEMKSIED